MHLALFLIFVCGAAVSWAADFSAAPVNTAALVGESVNFTCRHELSNTYSEMVKWSFGDEAVFQNIKHEGNSNPKFESKYQDKFSYDIDTLHDITLMEVEFADAGRYKCEFSALTGDAPTSFRVMEFVSAGELWCPEDKDLYNQSTPILECKVTVQGAMDPELRWWRDGQLVEGGELIRAADDEGNDAPALRKFVYKYNFTATPEHHDSVFECRLAFTSGSEESTSVPTYTDSCSTHITVKHHATEVHFWPDPSAGDVNVVVGDVINCTGNSVADQMSYYWERLEGGGSGSEEGDTLTITDNMIGHNKYKCTLTTVINQAPSSVEGEISFTASADPNSGSGLRASVGSLMMVLSVLLLAARW